MPLIPEGEQIEQIPTTLSSLMRYPVGGHIMTSVECRIPNNNRYLEPLLVSWNPDRNNLLVRMIDRDILYYMHHKNCSIDEYTSNTLCRINFKYSNDKLVPVDFDISIPYRDEFDDLSSSQLRPDLVVATYKPKTKEPPTLHLLKMDKEMSDEKIITNAAKFLKPDVDFSQQFRLLYNWIHFALANPNGSIEHWDLDHPVISPLLRIKFDDLSQSHLRETIEKRLSLAYHDFANTFALPEGLKTQATEAIMTIFQLHSQEAFFSCLELFSNSPKDANTIMPIIKTYRRLGLINFEDSNMQAGNYALIINRSPIAPLSYPHIFLGRYNGPTIRKSDKAMFESSFVAKVRPGNILSFCIDSKYPKPTQIPAQHAVLIPLQQ